MDHHLKPAGVAHPCHSQLHHCLCSSHSPRLIRLTELELLTVFVLLVAFGVTCVTRLLYVTDTATSLCSCFDVWNSTDVLNYYWLPNISACALLSSCPECRLLTKLTSVCWLLCTQIIRRPLRVPLSSTVHSVPASKLTQSQLVYGGPSPQLTGSKASIVAYHDII